MAQTVSEETGEPRRPGEPRTGGRVALITGASSGIGAEVVARLVADGRWRLLLNGRDPRRLGLVAATGACVTIPEDLSVPGGSERLAHQALEVTGGRVDLLVAGAGIGWFGPFAQMPQAQIDRMLDLNLTSVVHLVRLLLPGMLRRRRGHIVLISSIAGCVGVRDEAVYSATKAALRTFADSLRYEVAPHGVRVTTVMPGAVDTPFFERRGTPYQRERPRPVPPGQVADAVWRAVERHRDEVFVPGWLGVPGRIHGAVPGTFRRLAARFG